MCIIFSLKGEVISSRKSSILLNFSEVEGGVNRKRNEKLQMYFRFCIVIDLD